MKKCAASSWLWRSYIQTLPSPESHTLTLAAGKHCTTMARRQSSPGQRTTSIPIRVIESLYRMYDQSHYTMYAESSLKQPFYYHARSSHCEHIQCNKCCLSWRPQVMLEHVLNICIYINILQYCCCCYQALKPGEVCSAVSVVRV